MGEVFKTEPHLIPVLEELGRLEPIFHTPEFGTTIADFDRRMDASYWEVGASGRRYSREDILAILKKRTGGDGGKSWRKEDFHLRKLAPTVYLVTYTLFQDERVTRRATCWHRTTAGWKILYHQGTIVQEPDKS